VGVRGNETATGVFSMQRNTACFIGHHLLRSRGLNPDNPATPLVELIVLSEHLWGKLEQAFDARLSTWRALRERGQAVAELATYWRLADELRALDKEVATARQVATPLPSLWPIRPVAQRLTALDSLVQRELATFRILHVLVLIYAIGAALDDSSPSGQAAKAVLRRVLNLKPTEARLIALWENVILGAAQDIRGLVGSTRSYVRQGVKWKTSELEKTDRGQPHGLTAHGHSAKERDRVAANVDQDIDDPDDGGSREFNSIESLDPDRRHDLLNSLLPELIRRANPRQRELLEAVLLQGNDPSKAWKSRSDWNGLMNMAMRIGKAHSGDL
jgi:hypothetical protein